jgi:flagellin-like hook-associated protein FlgL
MTPKVRRELERLRALAKTRRAAAFKATQRRLMSGKRISEPKDKAATW